MRTRFTILAVAAAMSAAALPPVNAEMEQREALKSSNHAVIVPGEGEAASVDSVKAMIERFYVDQYRNFQDPEAPYFLMMSRDAQLAMGIGGAVRMRGWYSFDGAMPYNGFIPYTIYVPNSPEHQRSLKATPAGTSLFFRIIGNHHTVGKFSAYVQGGFSGYNNIDFKLKKAYVTMNDFTVGYAPSAFCDLAANPPVLDAKGPCGQTDNTHVLVQWTHALRHGWTVAASAEFPTSQVGADGTSTSELDDWLPDFIVYGQKEWAQGMGHVRLSALLRTMPYRDLVAAKNRNLMGYGAQISAVVPLSYNITFYGEAVAGRGISSYIEDLSNAPLDLVPIVSDPGKMKAPWSTGYTAGLKYHFRPNLFLSVCGSRCGLRRPGRIEGDTYKYGLYGAANLVWNPAPRIQMGAEYLIGQRANHNGEKGHAQRVNLMFQFAF